MFNPERLDTLLFIPLRPAFHLFGASTTVFLNYYEQMNTLNLKEAEIQLLIALIEIEDPVETPNNNFYSFYPESIEQAAKYFRKYLEDWTDSYSSLSVLELFYKIEMEYHLTEKGRDIAGYLRKNRPPIWYCHPKTLSLSCKKIMS